MFYRGSLQHLLLITLFYATCVNCCLKKDQATLFVFCRDNSHTTLQMFPKILLGTPHPSSLHLSLSPATTNSNEKLRPYPSSSSLVLSREPNILGSEQHCLLPLLSRRNQNDNAALEPSRHNSSATTCF